MIKVITLLIFINISLFAQSVSRDVTQMHYLNKAKNKVTYLSTISKLSLASTRNEFLNDTNILTARNSRLIDMVSNEQLTKREREILYTIDNIILNETTISESYSCLDIARHNFSRNGEYIVPSLTVQECDDINAKFENFYETGVFSVKNFDDTILGENRHRIDFFDDLSQSEYITKKVKKSIYDRKIISSQIEFLSDQKLLDLSTKLTDPLNSSLLDYSSVISDINSTASQMLTNGIGDVSILNNVISNCNMYSKSNYTRGESALVSFSSDPIAEINSRMILLNNALSQVEAEINTVAAKISALGEEPPLNPAFDTARLAWNISSASLNLKADNLFNERISIINELTRLQGFLDNPETIPENSLTTFMLRLIQNRISENILFKTLSKINTIHSNINKYILDEGRIPSDIGDITASYDNNYTYIRTDDMNNWKPKMFDDENVDISFSELNNTIRYSNIFSNSFVNSLSRFDNEVLNIFKKHILLNTFSTIDTTNGYDLVIALDLKTINFLAQVNNINTNNIMENTNNINCTSGNDNKNLYQPNSNGGFTLFICDDPEWKNTTPHETDDLNNTITYRDNNQTYSIFSINNIAPELYYRDINASSVEKMIIIGGIPTRIEK